VYAVKHNPFPYVVEIQDDPKQFAKQVPIEQLQSDLPAPVVAKVVPVRADTDIGADADDELQSPFLPDPNPALTIPSPVTARPAPVMGPPGSRWLGFVAAALYGLEAAVFAHGRCRE